VCVCVCAFAPKIVDFEGEGADLDKLYPYPALMTVCGFLVSLGITRISRHQSDKHAVCTELH